MMAVVFVADIPKRQLTHVYLFFLLFLQSAEKYY